jgi:hypothetical protein
VQGSIPYLPAPSDGGPTQALLPLAGDLLLPGSALQVRLRIGFEPRLPKYRGEEEHLKALEAGGLSEIITCKELEPCNVIALVEMPMCIAATVPPAPTEATVPLAPLADGVQGAGEFLVLKITAADFEPGRAPKLSKCVAYSLQDQWAVGAAKPKSENYSAVLVKRFFEQLTRPRSNSGYALKRIGLIVLSEAQAATLGAPDHTLAYCHNRRTGRRPLNSEAQRARRRGRLPHSAPRGLG